MQAEQNQSVFHCKCNLNSSSAIMLNSSSLVLNLELFIDYASGLKPLTTSVSSHLHWRPKPSKTSKTTCGSCLAIVQCANIKCICSLCQLLKPCSVNNFGRSNKPADGSPLVRSSCATSLCTAKHVRPPPPAASLMSGLHVF